MAHTAVDLLLTKIPNAAEIKEFISNNDADEKMLDEWLFERIYKGVDYKQMEREQHADTWLDSRTSYYGDDYIGKQQTFEQYYTQIYGKQNEDLTFKKKSQWTKIDKKQQ